MKLELWVVPQGISFYSAIWTVLLGVIEGLKYVKGQNLEAKYGCHAFAVSDSHIAPLVDR